MATAAQIQKEILDHYNEGIRKINTENAGKMSYGYSYTLEESESFSEAFGGCDADGVWEEINWKGAQLPSGLAKKVKEHTDGDGATTVVFSVGEQYFQISGSYSSWDGNEWDDELIEVVPKEVKVIRFFPKEG
jgi:hypothetical protein